MQLSAIDAAFHQALKSLGRFPLVLLAGFAGCASALWLNHLPPSREALRAIAANVMLSAWLAIGLLFCLALFAESRKLRLLPAWGLQAAGLMIIGGYYYFLPQTP